jgi:hypothetical protein
LTEHAFLEASPYFAAARSDLELGRKINKYPDRMVQFDVEFDSALAEIGLGDVASKFDKYEESVAHYKSAARYLQAALKLQPRFSDEAHALDVKKSDALKLEEQVQMRLKTDTPLRDSQRGLKADRELAAKSPS